MYSFTHKKVADLVSESFKNNRIDIVDFGCGEGKLIEYLADLNVNSYLGLDINGRSINKGNSKHKSTKHIFRKINSQSLNLGKTRSVDAVIAIGVLQYMSDKEIMHLLKQCKRVLRRGGLFVASCAVDHWAYILINVYKLLIPNRFINRKKLLNQLKKNNLKVVYEKEFGLLLAPLFSNVLVLFFDALDKIFFSTKGEIGKIGSFARSMVAPIIILENKIPIDFGYTLIVKSINE